MIVKLLHRDFRRFDRNSQWLAKYQPKEKCVEIDLNFVRRRLLGDRFFLVTFILMWCITYVICLYLFRVDTYGVRFVTETLKSFTISSTAIKRRPALPISPASAPQVLSPKRLCSTTKYHPASPILSILPQIVNSIATDTSNVNIHRSQLHHSAILGTTSCTENTGTISVISTTNAAIQNCLAQQTLQQQQQQKGVVISHQQQQQHFVIKHLSQSQQTPSASIMDASMGQIVPMPSMVLSQSMDSVNTATNEEEVCASQYQFYKLNNSSQITTAIHWDLRNLDVYLFEWQRNWIQFRTKRIGLQLVSLFFLLLLLLLLALYAQMKLFHINFITKLQKWIESLEWVYVRS